MITISFPGPDDARLVADALLVASGRLPNRRLSVEAKSRANELAAQIRDGLPRKATPTTTNGEDR